LEKRMYISQCPTFPLYTLPSSPLLIPLSPTERSSMPTLNHSRRAPPPPPLIRVFNPRGEETEGQVDSASSASTSSHCPYTPQTPNMIPYSDDDYSKEEEPIKPSSKTPFFRMKIQWLKRAKSRSSSRIDTSKRDSLPVSVRSGRCSPRQEVPHSARREEGEWHDHELKNKRSIGSFQHFFQQQTEDSDDELDKFDSDGINRGSRWVVNTTNNDSCCSLGDVLLFIQSDHSSFGDSQGR
jgi:hypothetical protein